MTSEGLITVGSGACVAKDQTVTALHVLRDERGKPRRGYVAGKALKESAVHAGRDVALCTVEGKALSFGLTSKKLARSE